MVIEKKTLDKINKDLNMTIDTRYEFLWLCRIILTTKDPQVLMHAYDLFFKSFRYMIIAGAPEVYTSYLEEVIYKIVNDEDDMFPYSKYGFPYNPFDMLMALSKEQDPWISAEKEYKNKKYFSSGRNAIRDIARNNPIKKYICIYPTTRSQSLKNPRMKTIIHKCFMELHDADLLGGGDADNQ